MSGNLGAIDQPYSVPQTCTTLTSSDDLAYQSISRGAVASMIVAVLALGSFWFVFLLLLPVIGLSLGIVALRAIHKYPDELLGKPLAIAGIVLSLFTLVVAPTLHAYEYATEVPPGYERVSFSDLKSPSGAVDAPTEIGVSLDGKKVFLKGYIHPTSMDAPQAKKFVLVPDLGTCCFGGQPPLTHMIEVTLTGSQLATRSYRRQRLAGTLRVNTALKPVAGLTGVFYELKADILK